MGDKFRPGLFDDVFRDVRHGTRALYRAPGLTLVCSATLALGIGAATAVFSVINGVLIKPLPYTRRRSAGQYLAQSAGCEHRRRSAGLRDPVLHLPRREPVVCSVGTLVERHCHRDRLGEPEQVQTLRVTYGTLQALGVSAVIGRWFSEDGRYTRVARVRDSHQCLLETAVRR